MPSTGKLDRSMARSRRPLPLWKPIAPRILRNYTDLRRFLDTSVPSISGHGSIAGTTYRAGDAGAQATAQSERTRPWLVANRFQAVSQASMMSARLVDTEL